jgi:hypothetical protein
MSFDYPDPMKAQAVLQSFFVTTGEFRVGLLRTNLDGIRGLEHPHQLEISVDGDRLFLETVGGDKENGRTGTIAEKSDQTDARLRVRIPVHAGPHEVTAQQNRSADGINPS